MPNAVFICGLPGSGKTTVVEKLVKSLNDPFIFSTDDYVEQVAAARGMTYDDLWAQLIDEATFEVESDLHTALLEEQDIIFDRTNLSKVQRAKYIEMIPDNYTVGCIYIDHGDDLDIIYDRLDQRPGKTIPRSVIAKMIEYTDVPEFNEGFSVITTLNLDGKVLSQKFP